MDIIEFIIVPIVAALITAGVSAWGIVRHHRKDVAVLRAENSEQHASGRALLEHLSTQVGGIDGKIDRLDQRVDTIQAWAAAHEESHPTQARPVRDTLP